MKIKQIIYLAVLVLTISCQKENSELEISSILSELKEVGKFENVKFEFIGIPEKSDGSTIKILFENSKLDNLNKEEFSEMSAKKIYNFSKKTKEFNYILISIKSKKQNPSPESIVSVYVSEVTKNFIFNSKELN